VVASSASEEQAKHIVEVSSGHDELVAFLYTGNELGEPTGLETLRNAGVPVFHSPDNLAFGIKRLHGYHSWRKGRLRSGFGSANPMSPEQRASADALLSSPRNALGEHEAKVLLGAWGVRTTVERRASTLEEALVSANEIGYPVVLKVESPDILHKTEAGALRLDIRDDGLLTAAYDDILRNAREHAPSAHIQGVLVQETVTGGTEVIVGVTQDPQLGPVLLYGLGGILVELMSDVALRICPIARWDAEQMIDEVKGSRLMLGFRGRPRGDIPALVDTLMKVSDLAVNLSDRVQEIDINPLSVLPEGEGVKALDALVTVKNPDGGDGV
jgi:acetyltransferase